MYNIIRLFCKGESMFGKIGDKIKRKAYLSAINETHKERAAEENRVKIERVVARERMNENRPIVSGKDAQNLVRKELNISPDAKRPGIINKTIADMKYYKNWRERIDDKILNENFDSPSKEEPKRADIFADGEPELVPGAAEETRRDYRKPGYRSILDRNYDKPTREEGEERESLFERLLRKTQQLKQVKEEKLDPEEEYSISDFEDSLDSEPDYNAVVKSAKKVSDNSGMQTKKRGSYKKKKKIDSDIIGSAGFFTIG